MSTPANPSLLASDVMADVIDKGLEMVPSVKSVTVNRAPLSTCCHHRTALMMFLLTGTRSCAGLIAPPAAFQKKAV